MKSLNRGVIAAGLMASLGLSMTAHAGPYTFLDPAYTAEIYSADTNYTYSLGVAFVGNTMYRSNDAGQIYVVDPTNTTTVHGTTVHVTSGPTTIGGAGFSGRGIIGGADGFLYGNAGNGIFKIDITTMTSTKLVNSVGGAYGMGFLPNGNLVYNAGSTVRMYNFTTQADTVIYSGVNFGDGLSVTPDGHIIVADLGVSKIIVLDSTGAVVNSFTSVHNADGTAFGQGSIFKGNTDGTITRVDFAGPNFTGAATETLIASGVGYHDLATVGPDFAFYLTAISAHYEDGFTAPFANGSVIRLSLVGGGGFGNDPGTGTSVPEPNSLFMFALATLALGGMIGLNRRRLNAMRG